MTPAEARRQAKRAGMRPMEPGDKIMGPLGQPIYEEPSLKMPGWRAVTYTFDGNPVGVLIMRNTDAKLRYCDPEGRMHEEPVGGGVFELQMRAGMVRMGTIIRQFLGERHPLANAAAANARPA